MTESGRPPKKPAMSARTRPIPTPTKPAIRPIFSVFGVPSAMTVQRSRPWVSVPRKCCAFGGRRGNGRADVGLLGIDHQRADDREDDDRADHQQPDDQLARDARVVQELEPGPAPWRPAWARRRRRSSCCRCRILGSRTGMIRSMMNTATASVTISMNTIPLMTKMSLPRMDAEQQAAQTRVVEDRLDQDRAGDDRAEREGEGRDLRQQGVAHPVADEDPVGLQPLRLGVHDVVLTQHVDHQAAHPERPEADGAQHDRQRRQERVPRDVDRPSSC